MIRKLNGVLLVALLVLFAAKGLVGLAKAPRPAAADAAPAPARAADGELAPNVLFETWVPLAVENPTTARNGYLLDVIRAVFPRARLVRVSSLTVEKTRELLAADSNMVCVAYGDHPRLRDLAHAPTPLMCADVVVYTRRSLAWTYRDETSLDAIRLGMEGGYLDCPAVRAYVERMRDTPRAVKVFAADSPYAGRPFLAIDQGEVDGIVQTRTDYQAASLGRTAELLMNYNVSPAIDCAAILLTVSNADPAHARRLVAAYEAGLKRIEASGELRRIRAYYGHESP